MGISGGIPGTTRYKKQLEKEKKKREEKKKKKDALYMSKFSDKYHKEMAERQKKFEAKNATKKEESKTKTQKKENNKSTTPDNKKVEKKVEKTRLTKEERKKHEKIAKDERKKMVNEKGEKKAKGATTKGGPVKDGVKFARSKGDDLAGFRRGPGTGRKDTSITKHLKKSGFTEDRLARLRKKHAEFKAKKKAFRQNKRNKNKLKKNTMGG